MARRRIAQRETRKAGDDLPGASSPIITTASELPRKVRIMKKLAIALSGALLLAPSTGYCGGYLMWPPTPNSTIQDISGITAPLSSWSDVESYDTAAECNAARALYQKKYRSKKGQVTVIDALKCIASDDPRLVGDK
jgi:hypothetical protein